MKHSQIAQGYNSKELLISTMHQTTWTSWFMIGIKENSDTLGLYGRKPDILVKICGSDEMPDKVEFSHIKSSFKYDWAKRRFKGSNFCWDADAVLIRNDPNII